MKSNGEVLWDETLRVIENLTGTKINKIRIKDVYVEPWEHGNGKNIVIQLTNDETYIWQMFWHGMKK